MSRRPRAAATRRRLAVVGTRGVPARYGGFETLAEQLARHLDPSDVTLTIYGEKAAYSAEERAGDFHGHRRVWMPLSAGGAQSLLHDALHLFHAAFVERHAAILLLGTSGAWLLPLVRLLRPRTRVITNIDGLEWRRDKFGSFAKRLLRALEGIAVRFSDAIIADNDALVPIVRDIHGIEPVMIAYGADQVRIVGDAGSDPAGYALAIARVEPENQTAMLLEAARLADMPIVFIGNWAATEYGRTLRHRYGGRAGARLLDPIYDQDALAGLRSGSAVYLHGHSVGGTNPSLVEAIFHADRILAFDCAFNRATLEDQGAFFDTAEALAALLRDRGSGLIPNPAQVRLRARYRWKAITDQYMDVVFAAE